MNQPDREQRLSAAFVDLLDQLVRHCVGLLDVDAAGVLVDETPEELVAASDADARAMMLLQLQADEGPCLEAFRTVGPIRVPDLAEAPDRWPALVDAAGAFASVHAIPLWLRAGMRSAC